MAHTGRDPEGAAQIDELLDTLSHHYRREIIQYFETHADTETASLDELANHLRARLPDTAPENVKIQLVHNHLPKLAERDWIDYDSRTNQIRYYGHTEAAHLLGEVQATFTT